MGGLKPTQIRAQVHNLRERKLCHDNLAAQRGALNYMGECTLQFTFTIPIMLPQKFACPFVMHHSFKPMTLRPFDG
jgi:hypothetical protein